MPELVFQLRIELEGVSPPVWRRLLVPGGADLLTLHDIFQTAMGWEDTHLHEFIIGEQHYGVPDDEDEDGEEDDGSDVAVADVLAGQTRFRYQYDFGDSWYHEVQVEEVTPAAFELDYAVCLAGENACPPEDVGGPSGYAGFLEAIDDPDHDEHAHLVEWIGRPFDPAAFSVATTNVDLQQI